MGTSTSVAYVCVPARTWTRFTEQCATAGFTLRPVVQRDPSPSQAPRFNLDDGVAYQRHLGDGALSERQSQVLACMAQGLDDAEIAGKLGLTLNTIKTHGRFLRKKLHARNRCHVVALAYQRGLLGGAS